MKSNLEKRRIVIFIALTVIVSLVSCVALAKQFNDADKAAAERISSLQSEAADMNGKIVALEGDKTALLRTTAAQAESIEDLTTSVAALTTDIDDLRERLLQVEFDLVSDVDYLEGGYNYLAIGNSITDHGTCSYWWSESGMAASTADNDYYHLVTAALSGEKGAFSSHKYNFFAWETQSADRAETLQLLDRYLSPNLSLVTIQLSENVTDTATFATDLAELVNYVKTKCPHAEILLVDDFWSDEKSDIKRQVATDCGTYFADLGEIRNDPVYQCGLGTTVYDADGGAHVVEHVGVSRHPGDLGMRYIADQILSALGISA